MSNRPRFRNWLSMVAAVAATTAALLDEGQRNLAQAEKADLGPGWLEPAAAPSISTQPVVFRWTAVPGADRYRLNVGATQGESDYLHVLDLRDTSYRLADELPPRRPLYARISAHVDGRWRHADLCFAVGDAAAEWVHPRPGSPSMVPGKAFEWTAVPAASEYRLTIGTSPGLADVHDRRVGTHTRVGVASLPLGRPLIARVYTRMRDTWYWRDADFALGLGHRAVQPVHPRAGQTADPSRAFQWPHAPLATGYRLRIGSTPRGSDLHESGTIRVTSRFVDGLPAGPTLYGTLTTVYADRSLDSSFEFRAEPGVSSEDNSVLAALDAAVEVLAMAGHSSAWPRTLLDEVVRGRHVSGPGCVELAFALVRALGEQGNRLRSRPLNTCLVGNFFDCHTLVEVYRPSAQRWMLVDPTFAVATRRRDGEWATAAEVSEAVRRQEWSAVRFVPLNANAVSRLESYYIDYPLLFVSPFGEDPPRPDAGPSILRYYEEVPLPVRQAGVYAIRCLAGDLANALIDGRPTQVRCHGRDRLSEIRPARSIEGQGRDAIEVYRPRRYVF